MNAGKRKREKSKLIFKLRRLGKISNYSRKYRKKNDCDKKIMDLVLLV